MHLRQMSCRGGQRKTDKSYHEAHTGTRMLHDIRFGCVANAQLVSLPVSSQVGKLGIHRLTVLSVGR